MNHHLEEEVGELLKEHNLTLGLAESCTGGLISNMITNVPGSSRYFLGAVVAYSNKIKVEMLMVSQETIETYGAVSEEVASEMARGVRRVDMVDIGLAVTGIAGPDGGTDEKPVGTVYISLFDQTEGRCRKFSFEGSRMDIKIKAAENALLMLKNYIVEKYKR
ncbi:MAG: CinA family protein [Deltaproteobacteria bacterium]|nr:CinA family protein [Deltaproteobacteria bacterium]